MIMEELRLIPVEARVGPMIKNENTTLPYADSTFRIVWREIADAAGVPREVHNMDSRAGGLTEGTDAADGDLEAVSHHAGHSDVRMTRRYNRGGARQIAKVAKLRVSRRPGSPTDEDR